MIDEKSYTTESSTVRLNAFLSQAFIFLIYCDIKNLVSFIWMFSFKKNVHVIYTGNKQAKFRLKGQGDINEGNWKFCSAQMTICFKVCFLLLSATKRNFFFQ